MNQKLSIKLEPSQVTCIIDTREQLPLDLAPLRTEVASLQTGDYALAGCDDIRIERKSLPDLVACVGVERDRFTREVERLLAFRVRILLVEATWEQIESHEPAFPQWRGKVSRESVIGSLLGWQAMGLSIHIAGDHARAGKHVARIFLRWQRGATASYFRYYNKRGLHNHGTVKYCQLPSD